MAEQRHMLKKLTVRDIMRSKIALLPVVRQLLNDGAEKKNPPPVALCRILGRADKAKPGSTDKGDYVRFTGEFIGINVLTGERFVSGSAILPGAAEAAIYGALGPLDDRGQAESTVEFAVEVSAVFDETAATQYVFQVRSLIEAKASNPMQALLEKAGVEKAALPAPAPAAQAAPPPAAQAGRRR